MAAAKRRNSSQSTQINRDATEFGVGVRCGGWRLGLLVARNVAPGKPGRPKADDNPSLEMDSKVSMTKFAELAGVSQSHVTNYYKAWQLAAKAGLVPNAETILVGDEDVDVEADSIEIEDNPRTHWSHFYQLAKNPPKDAEKPKKEKDSIVDEDFGLDDSEPDNEESMTNEERAEADSSILRNELLEVLESVRAIENRLTRVGAVPEEHSGLLSQISSTALDISTMANAMVAVSEPVEA